MQSDTPKAPELRITLPDIPVAQPFAVTLQYCGDAPRSIEIAAIMPAHRHGMNYRPTLTDLGGGGFAVDGMVFHMPGTWEVQVEVRSGASDLLRYSHAVAVK